MDDDDDVVVVLENLVGLRLVVVVALLLLFLFLFISSSSSWLSWSEGRMIWANFGPTCFKASACL